MHETYKKAGVKPGDELKHNTQDFGVWVVATQADWDAAYNSNRSFAMQSIENLLSQGDVPVVSFSPKGQRPRGALSIRTLKLDWYRCSESVGESDDERCPACGDKVSWVQCAFKCEGCGKIVCG